MNKTTAILLAACVVLVALSTVLAIALFQKPRFTPVANGSQYIMFDNKTVQACWSGPGSTLNKTQPEPLATNEPYDPQRDPIFRNLPIHNPANLPFCRDLK
jgi:hypothetical protein